MTASVRFVIALCLFSKAISAGAIAAGGGYRYQIDPLGPAGFSPNTIQINDAGQIVLALESMDSIGTGNLLKLLYIDGLQQTDLVHVFPNGAALNNNGELLGTAASDIAPEFELRMFSNGSTEVVGVIDPILGHAGIIGFTDSGEFVGLDHSTYYIKARSVAGSIGEPTVDIGSLGGNRVLATDINDHGQAVGVSATDATDAEVVAGGNFQEAFLYDNGIMVGLGTLDGGGSFARAVNDFGQVVGESHTLNAMNRAFLYDPSLGGMRDIGAPGLWSTALDINNNGLVVGVQEDPLGESEAFMYDSHRGMQLLEQLMLPGSGWEALSEASAINNRGQIVGTGLYNGGLRAFLMTPVPEPAAFVLSILTVGWFVAIRRRVAIR